MGSLTQALPPGFCCSSPHNPPHIVLRRSRLPALQRSSACAPPHPVWFPLCRTVYTNTARVYQVNFPVTDASTIDSGTPTIYKRQVKIPPLWNFQTSGECPRPTYKSPSGVSIFYTNVSLLSLLPPAPPPSPACNLPCLALLVLYLGCQHCPCARLFARNCRCASERLSAACSLGTWRSCSCISVCRLLASR